MEVEDECDMCFEYKRCSGEKCTTHILYDGDILDFARAMKDGRLWGDIIYEEDKEKYEKETPSNKASRSKKEGAEQRKAMDNLKETILNKNRIKNCVKVNGKYVLKHKFAKSCENLKLKDETLADGSVYPGGCWAHEEHMCPFMHPDEKNKYDMKGKTRITLVDEKSTPHTTRTKTWRGGRKTRTRKHKV